MKKVLAILLLVLLVLTHQTYLQTRALVSERSLQWLARMEDEEGVELGMLYRWTGEDVCLLAAYDGVVQIPCPEVQ